MDLESCAVIRGIFRGRELILRSERDVTIRPRGLLAEMKTLGWGVLAAMPGHEIVMGGVTKPWDPKASEAHELFLRRLRSVQWPSTTGSKRAK